MSGLQLQHHNQEPNPPPFHHYLEVHGREIKGGMQDTHSRVTHGGRGGKPAAPAGPRRRVPDVTR